jgi:branched-chain amino acid aminotransferase
MPAMELTDPPSSAPDLPAPAVPPPIAWVDGRVVPAAEASVPLLDDGFLRGDAVFEAILVRHGRTHALDDHLARMGRSAAALDLPLPAFEQVVTDLLAAWGERDGALKLIVTRGGTIRGLVAAAPWPPSIALAVVEIPWRTALSGVKTLSYAANQWAIRQAVEAGADDALIVDGGIVHELPTGAVCLVHDGVVSTPDVAVLPILDSVTVRHVGAVVDLARTTPSVADVRDADELFVVSATRPVLPVHALLVGGERIELPAPGPVSRRVAADLAEHIESTLDPRR